MTIVAKVWIEEDCITCDACADICPEVFDITDESSYIIADVRETEPSTETKLNLH